MKIQTDQAMQLPVLTVVMPVHNGARWLGETLVSIYNQSFRDFELILVDDASTDALLGVLNAFPDPRLTVVRLEKNGGVAEARNKGVAQANSQYIAFCDADDVCQPERFEKQITFLQQHPRVGVCGTAFTCFETEDGETVRNPSSDGEIRRSLMRGNCFGTSTMMGRAELFKKHVFDQSMTPTEDYDLWTRLSCEGVQMANLPESLLRYRVHAQQASQQKSVRLDQLARKIRALYCARLLGLAGLLERMRVESIEMEDLEAAASGIVNYCATHSDVSVSEFRFMLAWLYQKLPNHGLLSWWRWTRLQKLLKLDLNRNYRFNIALLALLPIGISHKYFDTLIKMKR